MWQLNNMLSSIWITEEIKKGNKYPRKQVKMKAGVDQSIRDAAKVVLRMNFKAM